MAYLTKSELDQGCSVLNSGSRGEQQATTHLRNDGKSLNQVCSVAGITFIPSSKIVNGLLSEN